VIAYFLLAVILIQEIYHAIERKDLYNRIMAKDLQEYKTEHKPKTVPNSIRKRLNERQKGGLG
jgi:hypothetical protein